MARSNAFAGPTGSRRLVDLFDLQRLDNELTRGLTSATVNLVQLLDAFQKIFAACLPGTSTLDCRT